MNKNRAGRGSYKFYRLTNRTQGATVAVTGVGNGEDMFIKREG